MRWGRRTTTDPEVQAIQHVVLAGGSSQEWAEFTASQWAVLRESLVAVAQAHKIKHVTVRPFDSASGDFETVKASGVCYERSPSPDGKTRIAAAVASLPRGTRVDEPLLGRTLMGEHGEPDLVIVIGNGSRLPSSLVWELAYSELVFIDIAWRDVGQGLIDGAIREFASRHRRFGGVDD